MFVSWILQLSSSKYIIYELKLLSVPFCSYLIKGALLSSPSTFITWHFAFPLVNKWLVWKQSIDNLNWKISQLCTTGKTKFWLFLLRKVWRFSCFYEVQDYLTSSPIIRNMNNSNTCEIISTRVICGFMWSLDKWTKVHYKEKTERGCGMQVLWMTTVINMR